MLLSLQSSKRQKNYWDIIHDTLPTPTENSCNLFATKSMVIKFCKNQRVSSSSSLVLTATAFFVTLILKTFKVFSWKWIVWYHTSRRIVVKHRDARLLTTLDSTAACFERWTTFITLQARTQMNEINWKLEVDSEREMWASTQMKRGNLFCFETNKRG